MKYILIITLFFMLGACDKEINDTPPAKDALSCEIAYNFKYLSTDEMPVSCHTISDGECCLWKLDSGAHYEMCLDEYCIWEFRD